MEKSKNSTRYIVNVSAVEGKFYYSGKSTRHPHTNMAKAGLNMFTRTSGKYFAQNNIFMTCVDTGWVSMMNPLDQNIKKLNSDIFSVPIEDIDGAMRVLDPVFEGYNNGVNLHSIFLKDYK